MTTIDSLSVIAPDNFVLGPRQGYWTYEDYAKLPDEGQRYEVMDGVLLMAPSPGSAHQNVVMVLSYYLFQSISLKGLGKVFSAPLDVELGLSKKRYLAIASGARSCGQSRATFPVNGFPRPVKM